MIELETDLHSTAINSFAPDDSRNQIPWRWMPMECDLASDGRHMSANNPHSSRREICDWAKIALQQLKRQSSMTARIGFFTAVPTTLCLRQHIHFFG
jgi:hypothetical protein